MNTLDLVSGWMFAAIAALYALGVAASFARRFYPTSPTVLVRLAAPLIFSLLAAACFAGAALQALGSVAILGGVLVAVSRRSRRKPPPLV